MKNAADGDYIDEPVQTLPTLAAQAFDHRVRRGHSERHEQQPTGHADEDERALESVFDDLTRVEELIEPDVSQQMQTAVEEGEETEHAAEFDQPVRASVC